MAFSHLRSKAFNHGRSLSFPSKPHPSTSQFDEKIFIIRGSEASCSSLSSMNNRLNGLKNLYTNIDDLLLLPHIQQIISQEGDNKWVDQLLDGYISLLDACTTAKDLVSHTKHDVQGLLFALRRKDLNGIHCYLTSRKKSKKMIQKSLKNLRSFTSKQNVLALDKDEQTLALMYMLKEAESVTITMFEFLLSYVTASKAQARQSRWSLVSKMMRNKKVSYERDLNEFEKIDDFLQMSIEEVQVEELMPHLKEMESSIQNLEEGFECLFRKLIRTKVFLLNILNH
ncbi:hypothetical protein BUALT_Bualt19G0129300 [Buddleja alternifolia]|uniref:Uncharacterized protein n=1 Tax=Buddleja alternifolia TaxID=168488 RepID=A0AAV6WAR9_9LAMI|nr:hypothetical protein BUALT_Bualt19G0129300 [Buddleja alternifolia]